MRPMTQATKDALADAETLRLAWDGAAEYPGVPRRFLIAEQVTAWLWQNGLLGHYIPHECYESAVSAARIAFRAVPGLRGE